MTRFDIVMLVIGLVLCSMWVGVWIWISAAVRRDANRRGMKGLAWGVLCFFSGLIGLVFYRIIRGPKLEEEASRSKLSNVKDEGLRAGGGRP